MNRVDLLAKVRGITELTVDDIDDSTVLMYARDGYERIINMERRWPFFETSIQFTTVAADDTYSMATDLGDLREIISFLDTSNGWKLDRIGYEQGEEAWATTLSGRPQQWSLWAGSVKLWPAPASTYTYTVRGYRKNVAWYNDDTLEIDCDDRLHAAVVYFTVARMYQAQEDAEMSNFYAQTFAEAARSARDEIMRPSSQQPRVLNQGLRFGPGTFSRFGG